MVNNCIPQKRLRSLLWTTYPPLLKEGLEPNLENLEDFTISPEDLGHAYVFADPNWVNNVEFSLIPIDTYCGSC